MIGCITAEPVVENKGTIKSVINPSEEIKGEKQKRQKDSRKAEVNLYILQQ